MQAKLLGAQTHSKDVEEQMASKAAESDAALQAMRAERVTLQQQVTASLLNGVFSTALQNFQAVPQRLLVASRAPN